MLPPLSTLSWPLSVTVALPSPAVSLLTPETQHIHPGVLALSTGAGRPLAPRSGLRKVYTQGPLEDESRAVSAAASFLSFCSWQVPGLCMHDCLHSLDLSYWFGDPCAPWAKGRCWVRARTGREDRKKGGGAGKGRSRKDQCGHPMRTD